MAEWTINNNVLSITGAEGVLGTGDNNALAIETNGKECLWVDPNGSVGVGTADPVATLDIAGGTLHINEPASDPTAIETPVQGAYIAWNALTGGTGETDFINNPGEGGGGFAFMNTLPSGKSRTTLMVITGAGSVGVGTADPVATLDIAGGTLHINEPASDPTAIETPVQGAYIAWNALNGSTGETDFINNQGGGGGGFAFMNTSGSENSRTIVMFIDGEGNVKITGNLLVAKPDEPGQFGNVGEILWPPTVTGSG
jgi:hypothetical protein